MKKLTTKNDVRGSALNPKPFEIYIFFYFQCDNLEASLLVYKSFKLVSSYVFKERKTLIFIGTCPGWD